MSDAKNEDSLSVYIELNDWKQFFNNNLDKLEFNFGGETIENKLNQNHKKGLDYLKNNQTKILTTILSEVLKCYSIWQEEYGYDDDEKEEIMPDVTSIKDFVSLVKPNRIHVLSIYKDDFPYTGYDFNCSWDEEHGLGIMMFKDEIIKIGGSDTSFLNWIAEKDRDKNI